MKIEKNEKGRVHPEARNTKSKDAFDEIVASIPTGGSRKLTVCTLGGVGEIGMNWTLYGCDGKYVLVDAGSNFAPRDIDGVEAIFPDPRILSRLGNRLLGLVVTHFHEDHVGAIHRIWPKLVDCPIHVTPFARAMLTHRFRDAGTLGDVMMHTFKPGEDFRIGPFAIATVPVGHSTPECVSLVIRTKAGKVLHTGDWKIDPQPGIGKGTSLRRFRGVGNTGIDLMLCDSTNADREVGMTSEASVQRAFTDIFRRAKGLVVVASFASNVARMASVARAAQASGRRVALAGFALRKAREAAEDLGMLGSVPPMFDNVKHLRPFNRRQQVILCTGTQGEENASLTKFSEGNPMLPELKPGDVVIHSARVIPGNEEYLGEVLARIRAMGVTVVTADSHVGTDPIHVTGHPSRPELRAMYGAVRPKVAMPVHGTPHHLKAHDELVRGLGIATVPSTNGAVHELDADGVRSVARLRVPLVAVLGDQSGTTVTWNAAERRPMIEEANIENLAERIAMYPGPRYVRRRPRDVVSDVTPTTPMSPVPA